MRHATHRVTKTEPGAMVTTYHTYERSMSFICIRNATHMVMRYTKKNAARRDGHDLSHTQMRHDWGVCQTYGHMVNTKKNRSHARRSRPAPCAIMTSVFLSGDSGGGLNFHPRSSGSRFCALQCVAVCCSVLQCVAVCCSVLSCVVVCCRVLACVVVCCRVLSCVAAVCCSVL